MPQTEKSVTKRFDFSGRIDIAGSAHEIEAKAIAIRAALKATFNNLDAEATLRLSPLYSTEVISERPLLDVDEKTQAAPLEELELSVRTYFPLKHKAGMTTIGDILRHSEEELIEIENFGSRSAREVVEVLGKRGLKLYDV